ncbi:hypothetical protein MRX96_005357 [Rhipicephalus microplus]
MAPAAANPQAALKRLTSGAPAAPMSPAARRRNSGSSPPADLGHPVRKWRGQPAADARGERQIRNYVTAEKKKGPPSYYRSVAPLNAAGGSQEGNRTFSTQIPAAAGNLRNPFISSPQTTPPSAETRSLL